MTTAPDKRLDGEGLWSDAKTAITVSTGERVDPLHPLERDITVYDIAHSLARQCRYNGHVGHFLSVARHSLWVADWLELEHDAQLGLHGLLHDAAEAYLGDLVRPLKHGPTIGEGYLVAEAGLEEVIASRFDLEYPFPPEIHRADNFVLLEYELDGPRYRWSWDSTPQEDEAEWLERFRHLTSERRKQWK